MNAALTLDSEVWATAKTGMIGHVFLGDFDGAGYKRAACRSSIERSGMTVFHKRARFVKVCATCATAFVNAVRDVQSAAAKDTATEVAVAACVRRTGRTAPAAPVAEEGPCCDHATMYHGARGCSECGCTAPRSSMGAHGGTAPAEVDPAEAQATCGCGEPQTPGTVHRPGAPCYVQEQPNEARRPDTMWLVMRRGDTDWLTASTNYGDRDRALVRLAKRREEFPNGEFAIVRETTTWTVEDER